MMKKIIRVQIKLIDFRQVDVEIDDGMNPLAIENEISETARACYGGYDETEVIGQEDLPIYLQTKVNHV